MKYKSMFPPHALKVAILTIGLIIITISAMRLMSGHFGLTETLRASDQSSQLSELSPLTGVITNDETLSSTPFLHPSEPLTKGSDKELTLAWPHLLTESLSDSFGKSQSGYRGLMGAQLSELNRISSEIGFSRLETSDVPLLRGQQSTISLQVINGLVLGADVNFDHGATGASWGMIIEFLGGGLDMSQSDPMMMIDELSNLTELSVPKGHKIERLNDEYEWILKGSWSYNEAQSLAYILKLSKDFVPIKGRIWVSR